jgi:hypothetical protein
MKTIFVCLIFVINVAIYAQLENCESARIEYLNKNLDVKKAGIDPWTHYNYYGKNEGRVWPNCNQKSTDLSTSLIPNNIPSNGLIAWWPFNGNANDESGNGNHGTVDGATLTSDRQGQQAYKFDGLNDFISVNSKIGNFGTGDFSISLWVYDEDSQNGGTLVGKRNDDVNMLNFCWGNSPGLELGSPYVLITPKGSMLNEWKNCVLIRKGANISIYVNGVLEQKSVSSLISSINNSASLSFGARYFYNKPTEFFKGSIDDIGIWNRALTDDEIQGLNLSKQLSETKLSQEQYYKMVYEGESDNPYSSFEDYLASQKKENQSELITNSSNLNSDYASRILEMNKKLEAQTDTIQKIAYLNLVNSQLNPNKGMWTSADSSIYDNLHLRKFFLILPNKRNDPKITKADWRDLYDFLINRCNENSFVGSDLRPWFLYWNIMVRQYMGTEYFEIKWEQKILEEYTESNFPLGSPFYKECQRIVNDSNAASQTSKVTETTKLNPVYLADCPIGSTWINKGGYPDYAINAKLKKTGPNKYSFIWRDEYDYINTISLTAKSKLYKEHFVFCPEHYEYSFEEDNSLSSKKVVFSYDGLDLSIFTCNEIILYDELGKVINRWKVSRETN